MATVSVSRLTILKVLELVVACICIGLHDQNFLAANTRELALLSATFGGYVIIVFGILVGQVIGTHVPKRVDILYSLLGAALFFACGGVTIHFWESSRGSKSGDLGLSKGSMAIINGIFFVLDAIFTFRGD